jgi:hypothetical protein
VIDNDVNLARVATALERLATAAERYVTNRTGEPVRAIPMRSEYVETPPPPPAPSRDEVQVAGTAPASEFRFSASAGARLREGEKHDPEHKGVKPGRSGLYCPTKLGDGTWCQWRQAA